MTLRVVPAANEDVAALADRLELARAGWGAKFLADYRTAAESVERFPQMFPLVDDGVAGLDIRHALLDRFELRVVYVVRDTEAVIVAVVHARRRGGSWHTRLTELD
jgi:plasmid stabilization system protein ParE